jgi:Fe-S cluster assembly protein SufD
MNVITQNPAKEKIISLLEKNSVTGNDDFRKEAKKAFEELDIPTSRNEDWKYTKVTKILNEKYENVASTSSATGGKMKDLDAYSSYKKLSVFSNGIFNPEISNFESRISNLNTLPYYSHSKSLFSAINGVHFTDGFQIDSPIKDIAIIHFAHGNSFSNIRHSLKAKKGTESSIDLYFISDEEINFSNIVVQCEVEENAHLKLNIFQNEGAKSSQVNLVHCYQHKNSKFTIHTISTGGNLTRNDLNIIVDGENCETVLNGVYLTNENQHIDNHTLVDHRKPHCYSNEKYKGIMNGNSTGVFNGKVFVRQDAQKINAFQSNQNILLSDDATINTKPELEIYADDVKCSHGSTTGQLDEEAMFYLQARGIGKESARKLLVHAFLNDAVAEIDSEIFKEKVLQVINEKLK